MAQYEVVNSPGFQFPVGHVFETDALHPVMRQHVRLLRGKKEPVGKPEKTETLTGPGYVDDEDMAYDMALEQDDKFSAPKPDPVKQVVKNQPAKAAKEKPAADGPGENS